MADTSLRYLAMLRLIPRYPRTITAREISDRLEQQGLSVNLRSVQRDLEKLSSFFPLLSDESMRPFRWSYDAEASSNMIPALDMPAALALELARAYLMPVLPQRALKHLKPHFEEARHTLSRPRNPLGQWPERVRVISRGLGTNRPEINAEVLETVTEALLSCHQCELTYQARTWPQPETIRVHPYGLIFRDPNIYLIGTIDGREGIRQLVLHRATSSRLTEEAIERPEDFDLDRYIQSGAMGMLYSHKPVYLRLRCDKPDLTHLLETPLAFDQMVEEVSEDQFELTAKVNDTQDLRWWLTAQAAHLDVLEPAWLRQEIRQALERALGRFGEATLTEIEHGR